MNLDQIAVSTSGTPRHAKRTIRTGHRISERKKKRRTIYVPNDAMSQIHEQFISELRSVVHHSLCVTGGLPGCRPSRNVEYHRRNRYFYLVDLKNAYGQVQTERLARALVAHVPTLNVRAARDFLENYCMAEEGGLATGLPASPDLFNLYAASLLDVRIRGFAAGHDLTYTRYLDDLTFSAPSPIGTKKRAVIRGIVTKAGFEISHHKSVVHDLRQGSLVINGVGLEWGGRMFLPRAALRHLRGMIFEAGRGNVRPEVVHGLMGDFWGVTNLPLTCTELKVVLAYERFRTRVREERAARGA